MGSTSQSAISEAPAVSRPNNSERILVIEDDRAVQKALKRLFEAEGFVVDIAGNGSAGMEMFRAAPPSVPRCYERIPITHTVKFCLAAAHDRTSRQHGPL